MRNQPKTTFTNTSLSTMRLDKWLWVARFFKTRQLAIAAINGGKIHLNGQRGKPSKEVKIGSLVRVHKDSLKWEVEVLGLIMQRRPAAEAILLYKESEASIVKREKMQDMQRLAKEFGADFSGTRPTKRDRRQIHRFTEKLE